ncbi:LysR family transcriptional regulator [Hoeflea prorocentri]|uniref:LysR family transcriptional regulator n=1 Tax=Hoeflea prorocentri TaxID=1922333 RepID=A0A9X3UGU8_9HYPH|nr:LysR family transcriptional regulator [Hoeflea prorocentri]MCY6381123.1 LysR family transcriptional regulator [Hoeflea prorocentri]MDA5398923.1 LysR family transcriptional regulator [Hoeflea prorocentri]
MDIEALKLFVEVAKRNSFAAVARIHNQDPSTISRAVANLETELGIRLFQRTTRSMTLTEAGEIYLNRMEALIDYMDNAREEAHSVSARATGTIRITATLAFGQICLTPLIPKFREMFPDLKFEFHLTDDQIDLVANRIDLAVRLGSKIEGDVIATKLFDARYIVCASPHYLRDSRPIAHPSDLTEHKCLLFRAPVHNQNWMARDADDNTFAVPIDGDIYISSLVALQQAACNGLGPALMADWMVQRDLDEGRLVNILPDYDFSGGHTQAAAWLVYPSRRYLPYKVRAMVDVLKRHYAHGQ